MGGIQGLSNTYGTLSMSTSYNETTNTTWNAIAELFINTGNNSDLDAMLFVPLCTISTAEMEAVVMKFPSVGEVTELGGDGVSINELYAQGNTCIEDNSAWNDLTKTNVVRVTCLTSYNASATCGPCLSDDGTSSVPYTNFSTDDSWQCSKSFMNTCTS